MGRFASLVCGFAVGLVLCAAILLVRDGSILGFGGRPKIKRPVQQFEAREFLRAEEFKGEPASKQVDFDLVGTWKVSRFGTPERPGKKGRWEAHWHLSKINHPLWTDRDSRAFLSLIPVEVNGKPAEFLKWEKPDGSVMKFSINEMDFGVLTMTGDDDELYLAVRTEGGEERGMGRRQLPLFAKIGGILWPTADGFFDAPEEFAWLDGVKKLLEAPLSRWETEEYPNAPVDNPNQPADKKKAP